MRQLAMKGHGSALYAAGSDAYLGHILCIVQHHRIIASCFVSILRLALLAFLLIFVFPSSFRRPCYRAIHERLSMNERAARHEVITLGTAEGSQGETRKKSLT